MPADDSKRGQYGRGRMALIALLDPIRADVERGRPLRAIYLEHQAKFDVTYQQFTKLARRYLDVVPLPRRTRPLPPGLGPAPPPRGSAPKSGPGPGPPAAPKEPPAPVKEPPKGSQAWRGLHGIPDDPAPKPVFVARIPDLKRLAHGDGDDPKE